jgi:hypothetical protein
MSRQTRRSWTVHAVVVIAAASADRRCETVEAADDFVLRFSCAPSSPGTVGSPPTVGGDDRYVVTEIYGAQCHGQGRQG